MDRLLHALKAALVPGSVPFLILALALGVALLYRRKDQGRWGRRWLTALACAYWALGTPVVAGWVAAGLNPGYRPLPDAAAAGGATAVVVLSGGSAIHRTAEQAIDTVSRPSAFRVLEAARVYRMLDRPWVIACGGITNPRQVRPEAAVLRDELIRAGVPPDRILLEDLSRNTHEHAVNLIPLLRAREISRFVLVTSPTHMWRALATLRVHGLDPVPSVSALRTADPRAAWWLDLVPTLEALWVSESAIYDYLGVAYYWTRGWLARAPRS